MGEQLSQFSLSLGLVGASCSQNFLFGGGLEGGSLVAIVTLGANQGSWNLDIVYFEYVFTLLLIISNSGLESFSLIFDWV